jgi:hypothetical protein
MPKPPSREEREKLNDYAKLVFGALGGAMTSAMIYRATASASTGRWRELVQ